uniref:Lysophosphatidic acid receptor 1 n=1 Tax=Oryctolagus cuniculus TaxID=9986 RepID=A0A5F9CQI3_RABIT
MAAASTSTPVISQPQFTAMNEPQCFYNESIAFFYNRSGKYLATEWNTVSKLVMGLGITVCIFIMLANLLVMVAIYVNRRFHFPIYYLMANLAAADFFAGLAYFYLMFNTGPNTRRLTVSTWLLRQGLIDTSLTASVANLLAIAIERHITVFRMQLHTRMSNRRVVVVIVVIWTMAIIMGAIPSVGWNCICDIEHCSNMAPLYSESYLVFWAIFNLVTFVVMVVLYAHIFGYVRQRTMRMSRHSSGPRRNRDTMMSLLKTVVIVLGFKMLGPALWCSGLTPWPEAPASPMGASSSPGCSSSDPALCYGLGKQRKMAQVLRPLHPRGRPRRNSWLLALDRHSCSHCGQLGSEPSDGRPLFLSLPFLSLCNSDFQINK